QAKWPERNPSYGLMPARMLEARATTKAVSRHVPEAKRLQVLDDGHPSGVVADGPPGADSHPAVPSVPGGPAKPADQASVEARASLHAALDGLDERQRQYVYDEAKDAQLPNLDGARFTKGHAGSLAMLIIDAYGRRFGPPSEALEAAIADATPDPERPFDDVEP
ncbi:MAG TPA: hypothetical protein VLL25_15985, partial [Acidimicrobiales bacterium]|nr:hypothetical protein [Acidimicrobiales bacterium]